MKNFTRTLMLVWLATLAWACNHNDPDEEPEIPDPTEEPVSFMDTASLQSVVLNLVDYIPTWEELERFTNDAQRLSIPAFEKRALSWYGLDESETGPFDTSEEWMPQVLAYNEALTERFGSNMSTALIASMPPFTTADGGAITYPLAPDILDKKMRASTVLFLYEKSLGLATTLINFYPPDQESERFATMADFYQWFDTKFLPEKEAEARAAEIMKAEKYMPWPLEFELFITDIGGIYDEGFLADSSEEEILAFATDVKDRILSTVKANYSGTVVAHLYNNYHNRSESHFWNRMDYTGFDEIHFALFPQFDVAYTEQYMDAQLPHYFKIIENSGGIPWIASEISVFEWYIEDSKFEEYEKDLYETVFTKLENCLIPPKGISPAGGYMKTEAARQYVRNYFSTH